MKHVVVGTAGHIDHGKTQLVKALTGVNTDRLEEEQRRGITIDIGFAPLSLEPDLTLDFVDVPGHEKFVKNMLAGIWGIDLVLLVIAADESIKPQTREHFEICTLLRVKRGVIALTKIDLVDPDLRELATLEVREFVRGSFLEAAPIVPVSSRTSEGLDSLRGALAATAREVEPGRRSALLRLPVDRSFSMRGFGTVVTGTLVSGTVAEGDELAIYPSERQCRVRGIQVHGAAVPMAVAGQRVALNLSGADAGEARRGDVVARPGELFSTSMLDVRLSLLPGAPGPLRDMSRVRFHQGTSELLARVKLLGAAAGSLSPGDEAFAQLRLERAAHCLPGDRFVIRRYSPTQTIGGGVILDIAPVKHRGAMLPEALQRLGRLQTADAREAIKVYLEGEPSGVALGGLAVRAGQTPAELEALLRDGETMSGVLRAGEGAGTFLIERESARQLEGRVERFLAAYHRAHPLRPGAPREEVRSQALKGVPGEMARFVLEGMARSGVVRLEKESIGLSRHRVSLTPQDEELMRTLEDSYRAAGLNPPAADEVVRQQADRGRAERMLHLLLAGGRLVRILDGKIFHPEAIEQLKRKLWEVRLERRVIDIGAFKELTGTSRKNAIPLLEHLDAVKVTRRLGSDREILPPTGG